MSDGGAHERFRAWLDEGAVGEPARDLAIHAAVCPVCAGWVRAHDALTAIDTGLAPLPSSRPAAATVPGGLRRVGRYAAAAGGLVLAGGVVTFGVSQVLSGSLTFFPERAGEVLGATGSPGPAAASAPGGSATPAAVTATETATPSPLATPGPALQQPPTAHATQTARPTRTSTPTPSPTPRTASPTASPTVASTPSPTGTPTATPSPSPTLSPAPRQARPRHPAHPRRPRARRPWRARHPRRRHRPPDGGYLSRTSVSLMAAWAAASRATGTRKGEHET